MAASCDGWYRLRPARSLKEWKEMDGRPEYDHSKAKLISGNSRKKTKEKYRTFRMSLLTCNSRVSLNKEVSRPRRISTTTDKPSKKKIHSRRDSKDLQVFVKTPVNSTLCLQLHKETSIIDMKKMIADRIGTKPTELELSTGTRFQLCDLLSLEDHGIQTESNIFATFADGLLGGADRPPDREATEPSEEQENNVKTKVVHNHLYFTNCNNVASIVGDSNTVIMTDPQTGERSVELPVRAEIVPSSAENTEDRIRNEVMALVGQYHQLEKLQENQLICQNLLKLFKDLGGELNRVGVGSLWFFVKFKSCAGLQNIWQRYTCGKLAEDLSEIIITKELQEKAACKLKVIVDIERDVYQQRYTFLEQADSSKLPLNMRDWTCDDVKLFLTSIEIPSEVVNDFYEEAIDGKILAIYKDNDLFADFRSSGLKKGHWRNLLYHRDEFLRQSVSHSEKESIDIAESQKDSQPTPPRRDEATETVTGHPNEHYKGGARPKTVHFQYGEREMPVTQTHDEDVSTIFSSPSLHEQQPSEQKVISLKTAHAGVEGTSPTVRSPDQKAESKEMKLRRLLFGNVQQKWFDKGYYPILIANKPPDRLRGENESEKDRELSFIRNIDWTIVFDLYANSKGDGLCKYYEAKRNPILQLSELWEDLAEALDETDDLEGNPLWLFCNGRVDDLTLGINEPMQLQEWNEKRSRNVEGAISYFSSSCFIPSDRSIIIFLVLSEDDIDILADMFRKFSSAFQGLQNLTCIIESEELYEKWVVEVERYCSKEKLDSRSFVGVPLHEVNSFIQRMIKINQIKPLLLSKGRKGSCQLAEADLRSWKDVSVLCKNECAYTDMDENHPDFLKFRQEKELDFYRGNEVDWWNFALTEKAFNNGKGYNHVLKRQVHSDLKDKVKLAFEDEISQEEINLLVTIPLYHQPGSGATTLGKHILWELRNSHRCVVINRITPNTANEIMEIYRYGYKDHEKIESPVLVLVDADTLELTHLLSDLESASRSQNIVNRVCVVLHCSRVGDPVAANTERNGVTLLHQLQEEERVWFQQKYNDLENRGKQSGKEDESPNKLIGFMMLKEEFNPEFISQIVTQNLLSLEETSDKEFSLLKFLSITSSYGEGVIPVTCCDEFMSSSSKGNETIRNQLWEKSLSETARMLLLPTLDRGIYGIKMVHRYLGIEILRQLNEKGESHADIMNDFLSSKLLKCKAKVQYMYMRSVVRQLLIRRKRIEYGDHEDALFSELIEYVYSSDKAAALRLLDSGFQILKDPWVAQQAARLCYIRHHDFEKAHIYIDKAMNQMKKNPFLCDTKGQIYLKEMGKKLGDQYLVTTQNLPANESRQLLAIAFKALQWFQKSQKYADDSEGFADFTGYFHEAKVIFRLLKILEKCIDIFKGESGLEHLKRYLMTDFIPDDIRCWEKYHGDMKSLKDTADAVLSRIDEYVTFCEDASSSDLPIVWFEEYRRQGSVYSNQFQRFFGEFSTDADDCEARRRKVISMGVHRFQSVFECLSLQKPGEKLKKVQHLLLQNIPRKLFDQRLLIFITFALSTIRSEPVTSLEVFFTMIQELAELSREDDLYVPLFKLMLHWPVQGKPRRRFKEKGNIVDLVKFLAQRWEERFKNQEDTAIQSPHKNHLQPYKHVRLHQIRPPTYFFLAIGNELRQFAHVSELKVSQRSINSERLGDAFWKQKQIVGRLERLSGVLFNANWVHYRTPDTEETVRIKLSIPVKGLPSMNEVTFFLGFSWGGPVAYDVRPAGRESKRVPTASYRSAYPKLAIDPQARSDIYNLLDEQSRLDGELKRNEPDYSSLMKQHQAGKRLSKIEKKKLAKTQELRKKLEEVTESLRRELQEDRD